MVLVWPVAAGAGFLAAVGLVIALGLGSTNRYERERNRPAGRHTAAGSSAAHAGRQLPDTLPLASVPAGRMPLAAGRPTGRPDDGLVVASAPQRVSGWWVLRGGGTEGGTGQGGLAGRDATGPLTGPVTALAALGVVAGPFPDRLDAEAIALARSLDPARAVGAAEVTVVHGVRRPDGTLARRPEPAELAWLAELGGLLDRLPAAWDTVVSDTDPRTTLVVELAAALFEAGLPINDCDSDATDYTATDDWAASGGGVCLTPHPDGVLVSWATSDRLSLHTGRDSAEVAVRETMGAAIADLLAACGFPVQLLAGSSAVVVPVLGR